MTKQPLLMRIALWAYMVLFFTYLLGPLVLMSITAFNSNSYPQVSPWDVLTFEWFRAVFEDDKLLYGLFNSFRIGLLTIVLSVSMGLAGALILTQIWPKLRSTYYTVLIAPILIPGVVLGISTLVFWDRLNTIMGFSDTSLFKNGIFLTVLGQSTFIASYCMLVFVARLQRYDNGLTEAALDLGATHVQAFRKIQLPFLYPAIASASVLALLASFENYNTTTFTFLSYPTLTIVLSQKVKLGIDPSISALAFIIVALTVLFALIHEVRTRRAQLAIANGAPVGAVSGGFSFPRMLTANPAAIVLALFLCTAVGTTIFAQFYDPEPAKAQLLKEKRARTAERIKIMQEKRRLQRLKKEHAGPKTLNKKLGADSKKKASPFGNVFDTKNLDGVGPGKDKKQETKQPAKKKASPFGSVFDTKNLDGVGPDQKKKPAKKKNGGIFDTQNLNKVAPE